MSHTRLTKRILDAATVPQGKRFVLLHDAEVRGLSWRLSSTGAATWYLRYCVGPGRSKWHRIADGRAVAPDMARKLARQVVADIAAGEDPQELKRQARAEAMTFGEYLDTVYGPWVTANRKAGCGTLKRLRKAWAPLLRQRMVDMTQMDIERVRNARVKAAKRTDAGNRDLAVLRACLNRAVDQGYIERSPAQRVRLNRIDSTRQKRVLSEQEIASLLEALDARDARMRQDWERRNAERRLRGYASLPALDFGDHLTPMIVLMLNTGIRRGEAFSLLWSDVDLEEGGITIRGEVSKSGRTRVIPLASAASDALRRWRAQNPVAPGDGYVFASPFTGERLTNIVRAWGGVCRAAGLQGLGLHSLRHTFCTRLALRGADVVSIQALAGHSSLTTTQIYMRSTEEARRRAVALLEPPRSPATDQGNVTPFPSTQSATEA